MIGGRGLSQRRAARWLVQRLAGRGDSEHEQALVRIGIVAALTVYAMLGPMPEAHAAWWVPSALQLAIIVLLTSTALFLWIVVEPRVHEARRAASMVVDHAGIIVGMAVGGGATALLYPLLLWVTLGHGFRYGRSYLIGSALISVTLFGVLVGASPFWHSLGSLNVGLALALVLIPGYCLRLLSQLHEARRRAEASSEAKSRFLATMSHELRTPLHAILGMNELLRGTRLDAEQRDMARTVHSAGHGLLNMIEDVLDIARVDAGADRIPPTAFDVHRLALDVRDLLDHEAQRKGLTMRLRIDPSVPPHLEGPNRAVYQILVNLLGNAVKFTESGHVALAVGADHLLGDDLQLQLTIEDTGVGVPEAARARIFESFTQADDGINRRYGGTGLGLAIVKRLAEGTGGSVRHEPRQAGGSRFVVELPVRALPDDDAPLAGAIVVHGVANAQQRRLLDGLCVPWHPAAGVAAISGAVDLWLADPAEAAPTARSGRDLIVLGDVDVAEALAVLPAEPSPLALRRVLRAALLSADPAPVEDQPTRIRATDRSLDVLVADDNRVNLHVVERLLARAGHRIVLAADGAEALGLLDQAHFDVAVLDLNMPRRGGMDVARALRDRPGRPRLLALSADATPAMRHAARQAGFDAYLTKPVAGRELLAAVAGLPVSETADPTETIARPAEAEGVIDRRRLEMLRSLDEDDGFFAEVVAAFVADGETLVDDLDAAAAAGDVRRFRDAAHALRSAATHLGATAVFERCLDGKRLGDTALARQAPALAVEVREAFAATARALAAELGTTGLSAAPADALGSGRAAPSFADPGDRAPAPARSTAR